MRPVICRRCNEMNIKDELKTGATDQPATREYKVIGTRPIRPDGVDKVTGRAR